jgi:hypothetical protein
MNTINYGAPSLSRAKVMAGALLATLAIVGAVQAATPGSASARLYHECSGYADAAWYWHNMGEKTLEDYFYERYGRCLLETTPIDGPN